MRIARLSFVNVVIGLVLLASPFLVPLTASAPYDPWYDLDENGKIDIFDVVQLAGAYGTSGDPGKNVTVTNWPASTDVTVWYSQYIDDYLLSEYFNASGFGHLHVLTYATGLVDTETIILKVIGKLWNPGHTGGTDIVVYETAFRSGAEFKAITLPVPSGNFRFYASTDGTGDGEIHLSFYLTWA
jgi:hypothetical protein